jgi:WD40 repeat protein
MANTSFDNTVREAGSVAVKTVRLWELATGKEVRRFTGHEGRSERRGDARWPIRRFGKRDKTVRLWELATGKEVRRFTGHEGWVLSVAVTPDGQYVVSGSGDETVRLWELATGQRSAAVHGARELGQERRGDARWPIRRFGKPGQNGAFVGAGDGERSAAVHGAREYGLERRGDARWQIRRFGKRATKRCVCGTLATGQEVRRFTGHEDWVLSVAVTPDGQYVVSGSRTKRCGCGTSAICVNRLGEGPIFRTRSVNEQESDHRPCCRIAGHACACRTDQQDSDPLAHTWPRCPAWSVTVRSSGMAGDSESSPPARCSHGVMDAQCYSRFGRR